MRFIRYALGEILLVVIGILIALQINTWNEERIEQQQVREYALNLSDAIQRDMEMLDPVDMQIRASVREAEELARYIRGRDIEEFSNADLFFLSTVTGYRPYGWNRAALEQLKVFGGLRKMRNEELVQRISEYDALTRHLDQDYAEDERAASGLNALLNQLVNYNYEPEGLEPFMVWADGFTSEDIERRLTRYRDTEAFARLAALDWTPLSQNLNDFHHLANLCQDYAEATAARPEIELPRLRGMAAEIQDLIEQEYR